MVMRVICPDPNRLEGLLHGSLSDEQQRELTQHLDTCDRCQQRLEALAGGNSSWSHGIRRAGEQPPASDSAFWTALRALEKEVHAADTQAEQAESDPTTSEELRLDFLSPSEKPGHLGRLDHFEIVEIIGRGGMGVVLKGFDECLQRHVAIKVLNPVFANNATARQRFCREARAAAAITHDNVVGLHAVEETEGGVPYLVMQYVAGESLQDRLDRTGALDLRDVVRIGMQVASGLSAAHAQGLIHRDIKPANILLETVTDKVKITDFGLARAYDDVKLTQTGNVAGTPLYMSPEQARGMELDHRTDLFSLGSVLYAVATGGAPFTGSTPFVIFQRVTTETPRPIKAVNPNVPEWLGHVIGRLQAKDPAHRFQTAAEVADLFEVHWVHMQQPEKMTKVCAEVKKRQRRARWLRWGMPAVAIPAVLGLFVLTEATRLTRVTDFMAARLHLRSDQPEGDPQPENVLAARTTYFGNAGPIWSVAFGQDGKTLALAGDDGQVRLWDSAANKVHATLSGHTGAIWSVAFVGDGKTLATGSDDQTVRLWDLFTNQPQRSLKHSSPVRAMALSRHRKSLATGLRDNSVHIWDLGTARETVVKDAHTRTVMAAAFSPDGMLLATGGGDGGLKIWDATSGQEQANLPGHISGIWAVAFSPDGKTLASAGWDRTIRLWDVDTRRLRATITQAHTQDIWALGFSPDGATLATGSEDCTVKLWDVAGHQELATLKGHESTVYAVAFSPDGQTLASGSRDGTAKIWDVAVR
jgi:hypothetical protein